MEDCKKQYIKIAIHHSAGSFSERWIEYCKRNEIDYKLVNAYDTDIVDQLQDCTAFLWHHHHSNYKDVLFSKQLLYSLQIAGKKVFPNFNTGWHFDDKVGQKYLLESIGAPIVPSHVFFSKENAMKWVEGAIFPQVFKLRGGAGAFNVKLVHTKQEAYKVINKAFGKGFLQYDGYTYLREAYTNYRNKKGNLMGVFKGLVRLIIPTQYSRMHGREKGYVYFQDFIPNNLFDIRVIVIGNKAFSIKRLCRKNDFRASGSGNIVYEKIEQNEECICIAFDVNKKIKSQCIAYDFVFKNKQPLIVEISYGFSMHGYDKCPGYWTEDMCWHEGPFIPQNWMLEQVL